MDKVATTSPKYDWRGYMLDVSRHFFTVDEVKRTLDLMHEQGLNVFHWHLTDGEGWRLQIDRYPKLTSVGAVRKASTKRETTMGLDIVDGDYGPFFYTKDQVRDPFRHVFATRDASMAKGTYSLDLNFDRISMSAPDDEGFNRALAQLRALARPKRGGAMEFTGAVIVGGER